MQQGKVIFMAEAEKLLAEMKERMDKSLKVLESELVKMRTGRANPAMIEDVTVDYYGTPTPLKHLANIAAPEADLLIVRPYDKTQIKAMERGILEADLGLNPIVDEELIRIKVPKLSEERRKELVKLVKEKGEEAKVSIRNIRRDTKEKLEEKEDAGEIAEDDLYRYREKIDEITEDYTKKIDQLVESKEKQLRTV